MRTMDYSIVASNDALHLHVIVNAILTSFSSKSRLLDTSESEGHVSMTLSSMSGGRKTYGTGASETLPVLMATMPH